MPSARLTLRIPCAVAAGAFSGHEPLTSHHDRHQSLDDVEVRRRETARGDELHRWYDATVGAWISQDPIGFEAGDANLYRYVGNMPTVLVDPSGLSPPKNPDGSPKENGQQYEEIVENDTDLIDSREKSKQRDKQEIEDEAEDARKDPRRAGNAV